MAGASPVATTAQPTPVEETPSPSSAATTDPTSDPTPDDRDRIQFRSPSSNIGCALSSAGARCDVRARDWTPPAKPGDCRQAWGRGLQVDARGARVVCAGDVVQGGAALEYGRTQRKGRFACTSSEAGMRCTGPGGHGFELARAAYRVF
ncbi:DUF6636 domain-containing protein [Angustibacter aerolatus]